MIFCTVTYPGHFLAPALLDVDYGDRQPALCGVFPQITVKKKLID